MKRVMEAAVDAVQPLGRADLHDKYERVREGPQVQKAARAS
jgi:hypothetical protein